MSAAHPMYPLDTGFVQLERVEGPHRSIAHLPTLLTFTDYWGWFEDQAVATEADAPAARSFHPVMWVAAAALGLLGAALLTLATALTLLLLVALQ